MFLEHLLIFAFYFAATLTALICYDFGKQYFKLRLMQNMYHELDKKSDKDNLDTTKELSNTLFKELFGNIINNESLIEKWMNKTDDEFKKEINNFKKNLDFSALQEAVD
jgi:hypothetical protein